MQINWNNFLYAKWLFRVRYGLLVILGIGCVFLLNYLSMEVFKRYPISKGKMHCLSIESKGYLRALEKPVEIMVTFSLDDKNPELSFIFKDIKHLLREFEYASVREGNALCKVEWIHVYQQRKRLEELVTAYGIDKENSILITVNDGFKVLNFADLYTVKNGEPDTFIGERVIMSAIVEMAEEKRKKIYFTTGHGEMDPYSASPNRGLSELAHALRMKNYEYGLLDLTESTSVPQDADLVVIVSAQTAFLPFEAQQLDYFLTNQKKAVVVMLSPMKEHGLDDFFYKWGVLADNRVIVDVGNDFQSSTGDFLIRRFVEHPITQHLIDYRMGILMGIMRPVRMDPGTPKKLGLAITEFMASSPDSWAKSVSSGNVGWDYDPERDLSGPISIGVIAQNKVDNSLGFNLQGGRLIVMGNGDFCANYKINALGNRILVMDMIDWCCDNHHYLSIPSKPVERMQLVLKKRELEYVGLKMLLLPCVIGLLGIIIVGWRYKQ